MLFLLRWLVRQIKNSNGTCLLYRKKEGMTLSHGILINCDELKHQNNCVNVSRWVHKCECVCMCMCICVDTCVHVCLMGKREEERHYLLDPETTFDLSYFSL